MISARKVMSKDQVQTYVVDNKITDNTTLRMKVRDVFLEEAFRLTGQLIGRGTLIYHVPCSIYHVPYTIYHIPYNLCHIPYAISHISTVPLKSPPINPAVHVHMRTVHLHPYTCTPK